MSFTLGRLEGLTYNMNLIILAKSWLKLEGIGLNSPQQTIQYKSHIDLDLKGKLKVTNS